MRYVLMSTLQTFGNTLCDIQVNGFSAKTAISLVA